MSGTIKVMIKSNNTAENSLAVCTHLLDLVDAAADNIKQNIFNANSTSNIHAGTLSKMLLTVPVTPSATCC
jgi:hypothetical protein